MQLLRFFSFILLTTTLIGCSLPLQNYRPSASNVQALRNSGHNSVQVGKFAAANSNEAAVTNISLRGSSFANPYGSYAEYIEAAVKQELYDSGRLDPASPVIVTGILLKNHVDAGGTTVGTADIEVQFTVTEGSTVRYRKTHRGHHEWPSGFAGAVALPAAQQNYHVAVQQLLHSLFSDKEFLAALKSTRRKV